ncbi:hypothetical protein QYS60_12610 [Rhodococcus sp. GXMU-t2271]|uniref:Uncharacterized protein n=2 Tax=Nocardiaceae TaxID=85025 RepID=A0ABT7RTR5_9NOCA|nr:hypothetical protein [Rhodococcus rhodochrous]MDM7491027.1 hypothetical protein [Rhodococcus indonesiensis]
MSTSIPRPGDHLPGSHPGMDPRSIHTDVEGLLTRARDTAVDAADPSEIIPRQAQLLEQAHDLLVQALATVDKI